MKTSDLLQAVEAGRKDNEIVEALARYIYDMDTSANWDELRSEARFMLSTDGIDELLSILRWEVEEYGDSFERC